MERIYFATKLIGNLTQISFDIHTRKTTDALMRGVQLVRGPLKACCTHGEDELPRPLTLPLLPIPGFLLFLFLGSSFLGCYSFLFLLSFLF